MNFPAVHTFAHIEAAAAASRRFWQPINRVICAVLCAPTEDVVNFLAKTDGVLVSAEDACARLTNVPAIAWAKSSEMRAACASMLRRRTLARVVGVLAVVDVLIALALATALAYAVWWCCAFANRR